MCARNREDLSGDIIRKKKKLIIKRRVDRTER